MQPRYYTDWNRVPLLLDTYQAAVLLQITPEHLSRMCKKGTVPAARIGKGWRISREVIQEMLSGKNEGGKKS